MALTLSNRETFVVMSWLESDPERRARFRARAEKLSPWGTELALPRMSNMIFEELYADLPQVAGVAAEMLSSGLRRVNFMEVALAVLNEAKVKVATVTG